MLFATKTFILSLLAISFDLVYGYAGIMSFGQALFFGVAGYATALLATKAGVTSVFLLLPLSGLLGLAVAFVVAVIVIFGKRIPSAVFVALGTLTGSYVAERLARGWSEVGGQRFEWEEKDIFCIPSWTPYRHGSTSEATLFSFNDFPAMRALGLYREEELRT